MALDPFGQLFAESAGVPAGPEGEPAAAALSDEDIERRVRKRMLRHRRKRMRASAARG